MTGRVHVLHQWVSGNGTKQLKEGYGFFPMAERLLRIVASPSNQSMKPTPKAFASRRTPRRYTFDVDLVGEAVSLPWEANSERLREHNRFPYRIAFSRHITSSQLKFSRTC